MNCSKGKIGNSIYIGCLYPAVTGSLYGISVWGYCFICYKGTPRPDNEIRQDTILTPFLCLNVSVAERIMLQRIRMSDIFNLNSDQPQIQNGTSTDKCPVCGHNITEQTKICPNCYETIWQDSEITDSGTYDSIESDTEDISLKEKKIQKYVSTYYQSLTVIAIVIAIPLGWITYKEYPRIKAVWFVFVVYYIVCRFIGYLLKGFIRSIAERKANKNI